MDRYRRQDVIRIAGAFRMRPLGPGSRPAGRMTRVRAAASAHAAHPRARRCPQSLELRAVRRRDGAASLRVALLPLRWSAASLPRDRSIPTAQARLRSRLRPVRETAPALLAPARTAPRTRRRDVKPVRWMRRLTR